MLFPTAGPTTPAAAYAEPRRRRHHGRPWLTVNMIASLDGATTIDGRSGGLGGPGDKAVFDHLRALADVIVVGAATVRAEHYRPAAKPGQRIGVVTGSGQLDWSMPLFTSGCGFVIAPTDAPDMPVDTVRTPGAELDVAAALARLDGDMALCEGGPVLNGHLLAADVVDELCLTVSPTLVGGHSSRVMTSATATPNDFAVAHVIEDDGWLFLRYLRRRD